MTQTDFKNLYATSTSDFKGREWSSSANYSFSFTTPYKNEIFNWAFPYKDLLKPEDTPKDKLALKAEERMEEYIQDNYDRNTIQDYGHHIYQIIQEKTCNIVSDIVDMLEEEYVIPDKDAIIEIIIDEIDFNSLYEIADSILDAPISFEDRLAEVGMSIKDFI